jgi:hypothetical protein
MTGRRLPEDIVPAYDTDTDEPLSPEEQLKALRLTRRQMNMLNRLAAGGIIHGRPPGTREVLGALSLKVSLTQARPKATGDAEPEAPTILLITNPYPSGGEPIVIERRAPAASPGPAPEPSTPEGLTPDERDALRLADGGHVLSRGETETVRRARVTAGLSPEEREVRRRARAEQEELDRMYRNRDLASGDALNGDYTPTEEKDQ